MSALLQSEHLLIHVFDLWCDLQGTSSEPSVGLSGGSHPGGMEALKNMLFTVQSIADQEPVDSGLALTSSSKVSLHSNPFITSDILRVIPCVYTIIPHK